MLEIDVCLVSGRRPALLDRTLESFDRNLFRNFRVRRIIANIDPIFGNEDDQSECARIIRGYDAEAIIIEPERTGFCRAVKSNWSKIEAPLAFHLEDDWILNRPVSEADLLPFLTNPVVQQIAFNHADKHYDASRSGPLQMDKRFRRLFGLRVCLPWSPMVAKFTTSPTFLRKEFAHQAAALLDERYDPEKQFTNGRNPRLTRALSGYRIAIVGDGPEHLITDTGRQWRAERDIRKQRRHGALVWTAAQ